MIQTDLCVGKNKCLHTRATGKEAKKIANATALAIIAFVLVIAGAVYYTLLPKQENNQLLLQ